MLLGGIGGDPIGRAIDFSSLREAYRFPEGALFLPSPPSLFLLCSLPPSSAGLFPSAHFLCILYPMHCCLRPSIFPFLLVLYLLLLLLWWHGCWTHLSHSAHLIWFCLEIALSGVCTWRQHCYRSLVAACCFSLVDTWQILWF